MDINFTIIFVNVFLWSLGFLLFFRLSTCKPAAGSATEPSISISIIIPARNEAHNLPVLLASLNAQREMDLLETIVVDDESTDETARVAEAQGAILVRVESKPEGWAGKNWACHLGAKAARGELLVFLDADTALVLGGLKSIVETWQDGRGVVSVQPFHAMQKPYEQLSAYFNLVLVTSLGAFSVFRRQLKPVGLFGPCVVVAKNDYMLAGGHRDVRGKAMEDLFIAETFQKQGLAVRLFGGRGVLHFRMYPRGLKELWDGWARGFATGAARTSLPMLIMVVAWLCGGVDTCREIIGAALAGNAPAVGLWGALYLGFAAQLYSLLRRLGSFRWYTALFYPVPFTYFVVVFLRSLILVFCLKRVNWKGRSVPA
jgi:4,4'-diaponeurosporenoate glycosyltransferase